MLYIFEKLKENQESIRHRVISGSFRERYYLPAVSHPTISFKKKASEVDNKEYDTTYALQ